MAGAARHATVTGRVQGVFFRQSAIEKARELGVAGWVRNCADGSVEAHVEGDAEAVQAMLDWLGKGPPSAQVAQVQVAEVGTENFTDFGIRH